MQFLSEIIQREFSHYVSLNTAFSAKTKKASEMSLSERILMQQPLHKATNEMENSLCLLKINILPDKELRVL